MQFWDSGIKHLDHYRGPKTTLHCAKGGLSPRSTLGLHLSLPRVRVQAVRLSESLYGPQRSATDRTESIGYIRGGKRVVEGLRGFLLQTNVSQVMAYEGDEPYAVFDFFDADWLAANQPFPNHMIHLQMCHVGPIAVGRLRISPARHRRHLPGQYESISQ